MQESRADCEQEKSQKSDLFWEPVSSRRWGRYISAREYAAIDLAERSVLPGLALEIGAEGGRWSQILAERQWQVTCTDIDLEALRVCQLRIPTANCILVDRQSQRFPVDNSTVRLLLAIEVHELVEQDWFLNEAIRSLEVGGLFVGVFQNVDSWRGRMHNFAHRSSPLKHYTASYANWRSKAKAAGLQVEFEEGLCWMPFGRFSNSPLVPLATKIEQIIGLRKLPRWSPWIVFVAKKC